MSYCSSRSGPVDGIEVPTQCVAGTLFLPDCGGPAYPIGHSTQCQGGADARRVIRRKDRYTVRRRHLAWCIAAKSLPYRPPVRWADGVSRGVGVRIGRERVFIRLVDVQQPRDAGDKQNLGYDPTGAVGADLPAGLIRPITHSNQRSDAG